jgi:glutaredoxin-related protein
MIVQYIDEKTALYSKGDSNSPNCKHRSRIISIFTTVVIITNVTVIIDVVTSLRFHLFISCSLYFVFAIVEDTNYRTRQ